MPKKDPRLVEILKLIDELFSDTRISQEQAIENMEEIECQAGDNATGIREDMKRAAKDE